LVKALAVGSAFNINPERWDAFIKAQPRSQNIIDLRKAPGGGLGAPFGGLGAKKTACRIFGKAPTVLRECLEHSRISRNKAPAETGGSGSGTGSSGSGSGSGGTGGGGGKLRVDAKGNVDRGQTVSNACRRISLRVISATAAVDLGRRHSGLRGPAHAP
jgi:hypothetical protein